MKAIPFSKVRLLQSFKIRKTGETGIRVEPDCVVGIQFNINAVRSSGPKGRLFYVSPRKIVLVRN